MGVVAASALCGLWYARCSEKERQRREEGLPTNWHPSLTGSYDPRGPRHADFGPPPVQQPMYAPYPPQPYGAQPAYGGQPGYPAPPMQPMPGYPAPPMQQPMPPQQQGGVPIYTATVPAQGAAKQ